MNKKRLFKRVVSVVLSAAVVLTSGAFGGLVFEEKAEAAAVVVNDVVWTFTVDGDYVSNLYTVSDIEDGMLTDGKLVVPSNITYKNVEYPVRSLGSLDAQGNKNTSFLTGTLSTTNNFVVDLSGMSELEEIAGYAFFNNGSNMNKISQILLPEGLEKIGEHAFDGLARISSMTLPESMVEVGEKAFNSCSAMELVVESLNVTYADTDSLGVAMLAAYGQSSTAEKWMDVYKADNSFTEKTDKTTYKVELDLKGGSVSEGVGSSYIYAYDGAVLPTMKHVVSKENYIFGGYFYDDAQVYDRNGYALMVCPALSGMTDKVLTTKWTPETWEITYMVNGGTWQSGYMVPSSYDFGSNVILPVGTAISPQITREGYEFGGWYLEPGFTTRVKEIISTDSGAKTFYAKWNAKTYHTNLHTNGGNILADSEFAKTYEVKYSDSEQCSYVGRPYNVKFVLPTAEEIVRTGYEFKGWKNDIDTEASYVDSVAANSAAAKLNFYAQWEAQVYNVSFEANGGSFQENPSNEYTYDEGMRLPTDITRTGYSFDGWYETSDLSGTRVEEITDTDLGDKAYYAKWIPNSYATWLNLEGGTVLADSAFATEYDLMYSEEEQCNYIQRIYNKTFVLPTAEEIVRKGYTFMGWKDSKGNSVTEVLTETVAEVLAFDACWVANVYDITYRTDGGEFKKAPAEAYTYDSVLMLPTDVQKPGYDFIGWYRNKDFTGEKVTQLEAGTIGDITLYASYVPHKSSITLHTNDGKETEETVISHTYGTQVLLPVSLTRKNYDFAGWYEDKNFEGEPVVSISKDNYVDKDYYAKWTPKKKVITLNPNGGTVLPQSVESDCETYFVLPIPKRAGYAFIGWYETQECSGKMMDSCVLVEEDSPSVLYAGWALADYKVTFNYAEGTGSVYEQPFAYGSPYGSLPSASRTGYTFTGWYDSQGNAVTAATEVYVDGNHVLTARWAENSDVGSVQVITDPDPADVSTGDAMMKAENYENIDNVVISENNAEDLPEWYRGESKGYYYENALDEEGKKLYAALFNYYQGGQHIGEDCLVSIASSSSKESFNEKCCKVSAAFLLDHPEFSTICSLFVYVLSGVPGQGDGRWYAAFCPLYSYDQELQTAMANSMKNDSKITEALAQIAIKEDDSDFEKIKKIHDYVLDRFCYASTTDGSFPNETRDPAYGLINSQSENPAYGMVCGGYARLFKVFCNYYGIENTLMKSSTHLWNAVKVGGSWYYVDCTNDDDFYSEISSRTRGFDYFLKGTAEELYADAAYVLTEWYGTMAHAPKISDKAYTFRITKGGVQYVFNSLEKGTLTAKKITVSGKKKVVITIPASVRGYKVTKIANSAFKSCKKLKKVVIGKNVTSIGKNAFAGCKKLKKVTVKTSSLKSIGKNAFKGTSKKLTVKAPKKMEKKYAAKMKKAGNKKVVVK